MTVVSVAEGPSIWPSITVCFFVKNDSNLPENEDKFGEYLFGKIFFADFDEFRCKYTLFPNTYTNYQSKILRETTHFLNSAKLSRYNVTHRHESVVCFTVDPTHEPNAPDMSLIINLYTESLNRTVAYLGVYAHDKDNFVFMTTKRLGQPFLMFELAEGIDVDMFDKQTQIEVEMKKVQKKSRKHDLCNLDNDSKMTRCYEKLWRKEPQLFEEWLDSTNVARSWGCLPNCLHGDYALERKIQASLGPGYDVYTELMMYLKGGISADIPLDRQIYVYEISDLIADIGGYLGLLLGASALNLVDRGCDILAKLMGEKN